MLDVARADIFTHHLSSFSVPELPRCAPGLLPGLDRPASQTPPSHRDTHDTGVCEAGGRCPSSRGRSGERVEMVAIIYVLPIKKKQRTVSLSAGGVVEKEERRGVGFLKGLEKEGREDDAGECDGKAPECILLHQGPQSSMLSRDRESIHKRRTSQAGVRRKALVKSHGMSNNQSKGVSSKLPIAA